MSGGALRISLRVLLGIGVVWGLYLLKDSLWTRLYPLAISAMALTAFAASLFGTPLVETIARRLGEKLGADDIRYCRRVTVAWVIFLSLHMAVTAVTLFLDRLVWALYNGFLAYLLFGLMVAAEYGYRKWVRRGRQS